MGILTDPKQVSLVKHNACTSFLAGTMCLVATAEAAAVRRAVTSWASETERSWPVALSKRRTTPWCEDSGGRLPGYTEITLQQMKPVVDLVGYVISHWLCM